MNQSFTLSELFILGVKALEKSLIHNPRLEAKYLLMGIAQIGAEDFLRSPQYKLSPEIVQKYLEAIRRRSTWEPIAKILEAKPFWKDTFKTTKDTLDPRPDSETLIETALQLFGNKQYPYEILDLGTGTGCLILSLLKEFPHARGIGVDISLPALEVARENGITLDLGHRVQFQKSSWFDNLTGTYDLIMVNPPYLTEGEMENLLPETAYDPVLALCGGKDGLEAYRRILENIKNYLKPNGYGCFEIGCGQLSAFEKIVIENKLVIRSVRPDLGGIPRAVVVSAE